MFLYLLGACIGVFQEVVALRQSGKDFKSTLHSRHMKEIIRLLDNSNPESQHIQNKIKIWSMNNGLNILS